MSPDRRAAELQKQIAKEAFKGRRKTDPPPVNFPSPRRWWESWIFRVAFTLALIWIAAAVLVGCQVAKQAASSTISGAVGLERTVTLYSNDGRVLREWRGRYQVEPTAAGYRFMEGWRAVYVSGTVVIEEGPVKVHVVPVAAE